MMSEMPPPPSTVRRCQNCGMEVTGKKYCPYCGSNLEVATKRETAIKAAKKVATATAKSVAVAAAKRYMRYVKLCPNCLRALEKRGDVYWCRNCVGWVAPKDAISRDDRQPPEQRKYRSQFHCNSCGRSFWVNEHRLKIPYCQECGAEKRV